MEGYWEWDPWAGLERKGWLWVRHSSLRIMTRLREISIFIRTHFRHLSEWRFTSINKPYGFKNNNNENDIIFYIKQKVHRVDIFLIKTTENHFNTGIVSFCSFTRIFLCIFTTLLQHFTNLQRVKEQSTWVHIHSHIQCIFDRV